MTGIQELEQAVSQLTLQEVAAFRRWFQEYDALKWDGQIEEDALAGKLDALAEKALAGH
ncbi:MAG: hypothetical protein AB9873_02500 [Syntrophobacteraceae bacterium]